MAEDKEEIKIVFDTNANEASKDVNKLNDSIVKTETTTAKTAKATNDLGNASKKTAKATKDQAGAMDSLDKGLGGAISSMKSMLKTMWLLVANPLILTVTAIVAGLALLFKAFTSTKEGGEALDRVMATIGATIDVLRDRFLQFAKALSNFDFEGIKASFSGITDEIKAEAKAAGEAARELQRVADASRDLGVSRAKLNADLQKSKALLDDENASYAEKKKALEEVKLAEQAQTDAELANAQRKLDAIIVQNELSDSLSKDLQGQADAEKALYELQAKSASDKILIARTEKRLQTEENARLKAINDERRAAQKLIDDENKRIAEEKLAREIESAKEALAIQKALQDSIESPADKETREYNEKRAVLEANNIDTELLTKLHLENLAKISDDYWAAEADKRAQKDAMDKASADKEIQLAKIVSENRINTGVSTLKNLSTLGKEGNAIAKASAVAQTTIDTYQGATAAYSSLAGIPIVGPALGGVAAGAAVAAGLINVQKILSTDSNGGGAVGAAPPVQSLPRGINAEAQVGFQASNENQIATSISRSQSQQPPIKAFVVGSDVTTQQTLDAKLVKQNSFGG